MQIKYYHTYGFVFVKYEIVRKVNNSNDEANIIPKSQFYRNLILGANQI